MRLAAYAGASTVAAVSVVVRAFNQRANFYSACVYLAQSNACLMILTNLILLIICSFFYGSQRLFYGQLRPIEIEQLYEKAWFAVTETCLAMTIFREEVGAWFMIMFVALLAGKVWGWIGEGRVEILEQQPPANPRLFHARLSVSLAISMIYDLWFLAYTINTVLDQARPNMMVMFLFEFAVLAASSLSTSLRYAISLVEANVVKKQTKERLEERKAEIRTQREELIRQREAAAASVGTENPQELPEGELPSEDDVDEMDIEVPGWEEKGQWVLTLDLATDLIKLAIYSVFFFILLRFYGLPIHIMRDLFLTASSFIKRLAAFLKYRRATRDMNERYPDATEEDIAREDTCIICREEMRPWSVTNPPAEPPAEGAPAIPPARPSTLNERSRPKKLPCGHILHLGCLKSWLERQQVCPTCRRPVVDNLARNPNRDRRNQNGARQDQQPPNGAGEPGNNNPFPPPAPNPVRMLNLGPFRVGFGHGQLRDFINGGQQNAGQNPPAQPNQRVFGFDIGFGRQPDRQPHQPPNGPAALAAIVATGSTMREQLQRIEATLNQEIRNLQLTQQELLVVQALQNELTRLRMLRGAGVPQANVPAPNMRLTPFGTVTNVPNVPIYNGVPNASLQRHAPAPGSTAIPSGHPDLPPGVVIPEGWSLLPLDRLGSDGRRIPTPVVPNQDQNTATARAAADTITQAMEGYTRRTEELAARVARLPQAVPQDPAHPGVPVPPQETEARPSTEHNTEPVAIFDPAAEQPQASAPEASSEAALEATPVSEDTLPQEQMSSSSIQPPADPNIEERSSETAPVPGASAAAFTVPPFPTLPSLPNWDAQTQHSFHGGSVSLNRPSSNTEHEPSSSTTTLPPSHESITPATSEPNMDAEGSTLGPAQAQNEVKGKGKSAFVEEEDDVEHGT